VFAEYLTPEEVSAGLKRGELIQVGEVELIQIIVFFALFSFDT